MHQIGLQNERNFFITKCFFIRKVIKIRFSIYNIKHSINIFLVLYDSLAKLVMLAKKDILYNINGFKT